MTKLSLTKKARVFAITNGRCYYCDALLDYESYTVDHKLPQTRGGGNEIENLVPACRSCNCRKHTRTESEFLESVLAQIDKQQQEISHNFGIVKTMEKRGYNAKQS